MYIVRACDLSAKHHMAVLRQSLRHVLVYLKTGFIQTMHSRSIALVLWRNILDLIGMVHVLEFSLRNLECYYFLSPKRERPNYLQVVTDCFHPNGSRRPPEANMK